MREHPDLSELTLHDYLTLTDQVVPSDQRPDYFRQNVEALRRRIIAEMGFKKEEAATDGSPDQTKAGDP